MVHPASFAKSNLSHPLGKHAFKGSGLHVISPHLACVPVCDVLFLFLILQDVDSNALVVAQKDFLCVGTGSTIHLIAKTGGVSPKLLAVIEFGECISVGLLCG